MLKQITNQIPLSKIYITDKFWNQYTGLVSKEIIPYQWASLNDQVLDAEPSHCIRNFRIAAGEMEGEFRGAVFQDSDVAKWLEAVAYSLTVHKDEQLEKIADETIDLIGRAQQKDGYLDTYFIIKEPDYKWCNLKEGHELYCAGHMIEAAVAYYEATGKTKFLSIVSKLADLLCDKFGHEDGKCHGYPGHQEIELSLIKLYHTTGQEKYLKLGKYFIDERGVGANYFIEEEKNSKYLTIWSKGNYDPRYSQSHLPVREQTTAEGHAVRAMYMYAAMADLAYEYQDETLMEACRTLWDNTTRKRMYITGGIGSSGILERFTTDYDLPNDRNYSETCASIGLALFGKRMGQYLHDASYFDVVERALVNTVLAGIALDGKHFFYVNPLEVWPANCMEGTSLEHVKPVRQKWFGCACCPPNVARTLASLGQYIYTYTEECIYINLYIDNESSFDCRDQVNRISIRDTSQSGEKVEKEITVHSVEKRTIALRIPEYASNLKILQNGDEVVDYEINKGYAYLQQLDNMEKITLIYEETATFLRANPKVREDVGKVAIVKGPFVYCLEQVDNGENLKSILIDTSKPLEVKVEDMDWGKCTIIYCKAKRVCNTNWNENELYGTHEVVLEDTTVRAIPYCYWGNRENGEMIVWMKELI